MKEEYRILLLRLQALVDADKMLLIEKTCDLNNVIDTNGCWVADVLSHTLICTCCKTKYEVFADTYHGYCITRKVS